VTESIVPGEEALSIAENLNEPKAWLIQRCMNEAGKETVYHVLAETLRVELGGGMMCSNGKQRRTAGGVFFFLFKKAIPGPLRRRIFFNKVGRRKSAGDGSGKPKQPKKPIVAMTWEMANELARQIIHSAGGAKTMKLTLVGTPEKVIIQDNCALFSLKAAKIPDLPASLPVPPAGSLLTYAVFVDLKQWGKIPEGAKVVVEGFPIRVNNMDACLASNVKEVPAKPAKVGA